MRASLSIGVALGLAMTAAIVIPSFAMDRKPRHHSPYRLHVRADKTIVPAPMQVDTSAHPRVDMPPGMQGVPTNTNISPDFAKKRR